MATPLSKQITQVLHPLRLNRSMVRPRLAADYDQVDV
jgi:hypothetical protein